VRANPESDPDVPSAFARIAWLSLVWVLLSTGCASVSPWNQRFVRVETPNFVVTSSFGEDAARALARDLETFHAGALYALGLPPDARLPERTRVMAFDDRGFGRPFATRGEAASLVPAVDAPILTILAPGTFAERVNADVRQRYARRLLRALSKERPPLWYAEGRAQVAGTIRVSGTVAEIGRIHPEHARATADWKRVGLADAFDVTRLDDRSRASRREFEAASWALVHTILFDSPRKADGRRALERVRVAFESGRPGALSSAVAALGARRALAERVWTHVGSKTHRVDRVQVAGFEPGTIALRSLSPGEAREALARLALDLGRPALALEYFERALEPRDEDVEAGRAVALFRLERVEEARRVVANLQWDLVSPERSVELELARARADAEAREESLARVLAILERADPARGAAARAWLELARLLERARERVTPAGEGITAARCLARAQAVGTGALEVDLVAAELDAREGRGRAAAFEAREVVSRSHDAKLRERARVYLESAD